MLKEEIELNKKAKRFDYKWVIVAVSFITVMVCLGFCSSPKSLFINPVTEALGTTRSALSVNDSVRYISTAVINIFFGFLVTRFGTKKLMVAGVSSLIISQIIYSVADNVAVYIVGGMFLGIGLSWTSTTMVGCVINRWCKENKGTIMGAVLAANGVGGSVAIQIMTPLIESGDLGYVKAYRVAASVLAVVLVLIILLFKEKSVSEADAEATRAKKKKRGRDWVGIEFKDALKMPYFYGAAICIFLTGLVLQSVSGVAAAHMKDVGLDPMYVGKVLSIHSLTLAGFKFFTGFLYDKLGLRTTISICSVTAVIVMVCLCMITNTLQGKIFAMIYGIFSSLALPLETIMLPIYAGDLFGNRAFDKVLGVFVSVNTAGYALGALFINICFDIKGTYTYGFIISAVIMVLVIIALQFIITKGHKMQKSITEQNSK